MAMSRIKSPAPSTLKVEAPDHAGPIYMLEPGAQPVGTATLPALALLLGASVP